MYRLYKGDIPMLIMGQKKVEKMIQSAIEESNNNSDRRLKIAQDLPCIINAALNVVEHKERVHFADSYRGQQYIKAYKDIIKALRRVLEEVPREEGKVPQHVCETCGCIIDAKSVVFGESEIRKEYNPWLGTFNKEYIYKPEYCKAHAPKEKKDGKKRKARKSISRKA